MKSSTLLLTLLLAGNAKASDPAQVIKAAMARVPVREMVGQKTGVLGTGAVRPVDQTPTYALFATAVALNVADIESVQACIAAHTCREGNPLVSNHRYVGYPVGITIDTLGLLYARWARQSHRRSWFVPLLVSSSTHIVGIYFNERAASHDKHKLY
jgi:hypothetical protein